MCGLALLAVTRLLQVHARDLQTFQARGFGKPQHNAARRCTHANNAQPKCTMVP